MTTQGVNPQFMQSIHAGLKYWQQKTSEVEIDQAHWLDRRRQNLFQAILFGIETKETWEATVTVMLQSFNFVEWGGYWQEWIPILEKALAFAPDKVAVVNGRLHNRLGQLYRMSQQPKVAIIQHEEALHLAQQLADKKLEITAYSSLCEVYLSLNAASKAEENGILALAIAKETKGTERLQAFLYQNLGLAAFFAGKWEQAIKRQQQAIRLWRMQNNLIYLARSLNDLGNSYSGTMNFPAAQLAFEEAGTILQGTISESDKAKVYLNLGVLHYRQEKWLAAEAAFLKINSTALRQRQNLPLLGQLHNNLGNVYLEMARWEDATENLKVAIDTFRKINNSLELANSLGTLAKVTLAIGQTNKAVPHYVEAISLLELFPDSHWAQKLLANFSREYQICLAKA